MLSNWVSHLWKHFTLTNISKVRMASLWGVVEIAIVEDKQRNAKGPTSLRTARHSYLESCYLFLIQSFLLQFFVFEALSSISAWNAHIYMALSCFPLIFYFFTAFATCLVIKLWIFSYLQNISRLFLRRILNRRLANDSVESKRRSRLSIAFCSKNWIDHHKNSIGLLLWSRGEITR